MPQSHTLVTDDYRTACVYMVLGIFPPFHTPFLLLVHVAA